MKGILEFNLDDPEDREKFEKYNKAEYMHGEINCFLVRLNALIQWYENDGIGCDQIKKIKTEYIDFMEDFLI
jgi:hypothetical protein